MTDFIQMITAVQLARLKQYGVRQIGVVDAEPIALDEAQAQCRVDTFGSPPESDDDDWLEFIGIPGARTYCENYKGAAYAPRTMELATNGFPAGNTIALPFGPVQTIESVYYDDGAAAQDAYDAAYTAAYDPAYAAAYDAEIIASGDPVLADLAGVEAGDAAGIVAGQAAYDAALEVLLDPSVYILNVYTNDMQLAFNQSWPTARDSTNSVRIRYITGPNLDGEIINPLPNTIKIAMLMLLVHLFDNREAIAAGLISVVPLGVHAFLDMTPGGDRVGFA